MLDRLANTIIKHSKAIVAIWLVVLLVSVPALLQVDSVVNYQITEGASADYESLKAADIIEKNFQTSVANGTVIVVLQSNNVTDPEMRDFVIALEERIRSSSKITYLENVSSVYSVSDLVIATYVQQLGPRMYEAKEQVNTSAFLLYGVPYIHEQSWEQIHATNPGLSVAQTDVAAFTATSSYLDQYLAAAEPSTKAMAYGYYHGITDVWNATAASPALAADPIARANYSISAVAPVFISKLPSEYQPIMNAVLGTFNIAMFSNQAAVEATVQAFTLNLVGQTAGITNMTFLREVYDLGPAYGAAEDRKSVV